MLALLQMNESFLVQKAENHGIPTTTNWAPSTAQIKYFPGIKIEYMLEWFPLCR